MGGVNGQGVNAHFDQRGGALEEVARRADRSGDAQPALVVLAGVGVLQLFLDVLDRDEALELIGVVDDEELFDPVLVQDVLGFFERRADRDRDELFLGHDVADGQVRLVDEAQVAVGKDADKLFVFRHGDAGNFIAAHHVERVRERLLGRDGDGDRRSCRIPSA